MLLALATTLMLALTRAEIIERFKAPVITQADGLVRVFANCPEDMRREYQMPIASFASDTVKTLYQGLGKKSVKFKNAGIMIFIGDVRTNVAEVVTRVATNETRTVTRIFVKSPGHADVGRVRLEIVKGFYRSVEGTELTDEAAERAYRMADPAMRIADERGQLEAWLAGRGGPKDDEEGLRLMRKVIEPGRASKRDVLTFASRLYLYPPQYDVRFMGRFSCLSFREALKAAKEDPMVRIVAALKANEVPVFGGGRGEELAAAATAYREFLLELGRGTKNVKELTDMLDDADEKLNVALEKAGK